jgi:hypothetical protein
MKESTTKWPSQTFLMLVLVAVLFCGIALYNSNAPHHPRGYGTRIAVTSLETAVNNFFTEYGKLPSVGSKVTTDTPDGIQLLHILLGMEPAGENPRNASHVRFLSVKEGKEKRDGLIYAADGRSVEGLYDTWGNPYTVEIDTDYDEILEFKRGSKIETLKGRRVAAHSPGPDRKDGTRDDITTW